MYHGEVDRGSAPPRSAASCPPPAGAACSRYHPGCGPALPWPGLQPRMRGPDARQRWKRLEPVLTGSKRAGRSCRGAPVRKIHGVPLTMRRCGAFGRPVQGFSGGRCAAKRPHRASGKSPCPTRSVWDRGPESSVVCRGALRRCGRAGPGCGRGPPLLPMVAVRAAKLRRTRENPAIRKKPTIREKRGRGEGLQAWSRVTSLIPGRDRLRHGERP